MKKTLKIVGIVLAILIVLVLIAPLFLGGFIADKVESSLATSMDSDVSVEGLSYWWFTGLAVDDVRIEARRADGMDVSLGSLEASPSVLALLGGNLEITDLRARDLVVVYRPAAPADPAPAPTRKPDTPPAPGTPAPRPSEKAPEPRRELPSIDIDAVVENVTVVYDSPAYERPMKLDGLKRITADIATGSPIRITLDDPALQAEVLVEAFDGNTLRPADAIDAVITVKSDGGDLARFEDLLAPWMTIRGGRLHVDERIERRAGVTTVKGVARLVELDATDRVKQASHEVREARLDLDLKANAAFETTGKIDLAVSQVRSTGLPALDEPLVVSDVTFAANLLPGRRIAITTCKVDGDLLRLDASGQLAFGDALPTGDFDARLEAQVDRLARVFQDRRDMSGTLVSELKIAADDAGATTLRGGTTIRDLKAAAIREGMAPIDEPLVRLVHDLTMKDDVVTIEKASLDASFARLAANGSLDLSDPDAAPTGRVDLQGSADLAALSNLAGGLSAWSAEGRADVQGRLEGDGSGLRFDVTLGSPALVARSATMESPLDLGRVSARAAGAMSPAKDRLEVSTLDLQSSFANLTGNAVMTTPAEGAPTMSLDLSGSADLARLGATFRPESPTATLPQDARIRLAVRRSGDVTRIETAELRTGRTTASVTGTVTGGADPMTGELKLGAEGRVEDLVALAPGETPMTGAGDLDVDGTVTLGADRRIDLSGTVQGLALAGGALGPKSLEAATAGFRLQALSRADGGLEVQPLTARLERMVYGAPDAATLRGDFDLKATVAADGAFAADLDGAKLAIRRAGQADFQPMKSALDARAEGRRDVTAGSWDVPTLVVKGDGIAATGSAAYLPDERFRMALGADLDNAAFASNWLAIFVEDAAGKGTGRLDLRADVPMGARAETARAEGDLSARLDQLTVTSITMTDLDVVGAMRDGIGELSKGDARINGGPAKIDLRVDATGEEWLWRFGVDARDVAVEKQLQPAIARAIPIFAGLDTRVQTKVGLRLALDGRGSDKDALMRTLTGDGTFSATAGSIEGGPLLQGLMTFLGLPPKLDFSSLATDIVVKDGAVIQDGLTLDGTILDIRLGGRTSFDGDLDYTLGIKPEPGRVKEFDRFAAILTADGFLPLALGGDVRSPAVKLPDPAKLIGSAVENKLKEGIGGLIEGAVKKDGEKGGGVLEGLGGLLGGNKEAPATRPAAGENSDPATDALRGLGGLLGGSKKKDPEPEKKAPETRPAETPPARDPARDVLDGLGGLLGGKKDGGRKTGE